MSRAPERQPLEAPQPSQVRLLSPHAGIRTAYYTPVCQQLGTQHVSWNDNLGYACPSCPRIRATFLSSYPCQNAIACARSRRHVCVRRHTESVRFCLQGLVTLCAAMLIQNKQTVMHQKSPETGFSRNLLVSVSSLRKPHQTLVGLPCLYPKSSLLK